MVQINKLTKTQLTNLGFVGNVKESKKLLKESLNGKTGRNFRNIDELKDFLRIESVQLKIESGDSIHTIYDNLPYEGRVRILLYENTDLKFDKVYNINSGKSRWWRSAIMDFMIDSDTTLFDIYQNVSIFYTQVVDVPSEGLYQRFADGIDHCVITPIINWAIKCKELAKSESSKKNYNAIINKCKKYIKKYSDGIPQDCLKEICDDLRINIIIKDVLKRNIICEKSDRKPYRNFTYLNTRENHVDEFSNISMEDNIKISKGEMENMVISLMDQNKFYLFAGMKQCPYYISTIECTYTIDDPDKSKINNFLGSLKKYSLNWKDDMNLNRFIDNGVNFSSHMEFDNSIDDEVDEWDMPKAYLQFKNCSYYSGIPSVMSPVYKLNNWNVNDCRTHIGYYYVKIVSSNVCDNSIKILNHLGFKVGGEYYLTSPEIWMFSDIGFNMEILYGTFCYKPLGYYKDLNGISEYFGEMEDFEFPNDLIANKLYAIATGKMKNINFVRDIKLNGTEEFAKNLACTYKHVSYSSFSEDITIELENDNVDTLHHIAGYITAYCRITTLLELLQVKYSDIVGWKLDGFIIKKGYSISNKFIQKEVKRNFNWGGNIYVDTEGCRTFTSINKPTEQYIFLSGAGGTGKTHSYLSENKNILFSSFGWSVITDKCNEYGVKGISMNKLIGQGVGGISIESYLVDNRPPSVLFIDEGTQIDKSFINSAKYLLPYTQIIVAADIDSEGFVYQCKSKSVKELIDVKDWFIVNHTTNYRFKCSELKKRTNKLRKFMKKCNGNRFEIERYVREIFKDRFSSIEDYNYLKDWILVSVTNGERSQTDEYRKKFNSPKYQCIKHSYSDVVKRMNGNGGYITGDILFEKPNNNFKQQDAFTIHGFQGKTISDGKLFIDMRYIFDYCQLYTAISRVEYLNQLYFIE